jgi:hypothetical protein
MDRLELDTPAREDAWVKDFIGRLSDVFRRSARSKRRPPTFRDRHGLNKKSAPTFQELPGRDVDSNRIYKDRRRVAARGHIGIVVHRRRREIGRGNGTGTIQPSCVAVWCLSIAPGYCLASSTPTQVRLAPVDAKALGRTPVISTRKNDKRNFPTATRFTRTTLATSPAEPRSKSGQTAIIHATRNSNRDADRLAAAVADLSELPVRTG